jgi:hypothetical protein
MRDMRGRKSLTGRTYPRGDRDVITFASEAVE